MVFILIVNNMHFILTLFCMIKMLQKKKKRKKKKIIFFFIYIFYFKYSQKKVTHNN